MEIKSKFGPKYQEFAIGDIVFLAKSNPLELQNGSKISNFPVAYQAYGKLNKDKSNAILICHALTGDQYCASQNPVTKRNGWWDFMIGKDKPIDTNKFFVICSNIIGGCMGSWGPKEINPDSGKPYAMQFPIVTIYDMVEAQNLLIQHFGIEKLHAVIGGSTGGMQALCWSILYPSKVKNVVPIASSYRHSPQNIAFHEVGRQAIMADPNWQSGDYLSKKIYPTKGLAVARMTAHITYMSENALHSKFGRNLQDKAMLSFSFDKDFKIESYLHHKGFSFVDRFDANSYLYITKAVDYFDLESDFDNKLTLAFTKFSQNNADGKFYLISFSDDWLFPPSEMKKITKALIACDIDVSSIIIDSEAGHDSFLINNESLKQTISNILK